MSSPIDESTVSRIAALARLKLAPDEIHRFTEQLGAILTYFEQLNRVNTDGVEPNAHATPASNALRDDQPIPPLDRAAALAAAPGRADGFLLLPKVLGQETA